MWKISEQDILLAIIILRRRRRRICRSRWIHPLNKLRPQLGEHIKVEIMYSSYPQEFTQYTRLTPPQFDKLLCIIKPSIIKESTQFRDSIPPHHRLYIALR